VRNTYTRYEVILTHQVGYPHGQRLLVGYTPRRSRPGLVEVMRQHGDAIIAITGLQDSHITVYKPDTKTYNLGPDGWSVTFSGRTQIDAQDHGELQWVRDI
jgi:hypothetical protein